MGRNLLRAAVDPQAQKRAAKIENHPAQKRQLLVWEPPLKTKLAVYMIRAKAMLPRGIKEVILKSHLSISRPIRTLKKMKKRRLLDLLAQTVGKLKKLSLHPGNRKLRKEAQAPVTVLNQ
jgi:predicted CopG family antitoxin